MIAAARQVSFESPVVTFLVRIAVNVVLVLIARDVLGYTNNSLTPVERAEALTSVLALAGDGRVLVEHHIRPLAEVAAAWADVASGAVRQVLVP